MNRKSSKRAGAKNIGGWLYTILFLMLMVPLLICENTDSSLAYYGAMFGIGHNAFINDLTLFILKEYGVFIVVGLILCFPVREKISDSLRGKFGDNVIGIIEDTALIILTVVSIAFVIKTGSSFFIYQMY